MHLHFIYKKRNICIHMKKREMNVTHLFMQHIYLNICHLLFVWNRSMPRKGVAFFFLIRMAIQVHVRAEKETRDMVYNHVRKIELMVNYFIYFRF
jgi:hypothetical protein